MEHTQAEIEAVIAEFPAALMRREYIRLRDLLDCTPICPDHNPVARLVQLPPDLGGGIVREHTCSSCGFYGVSHPDQEI